MSFLLANPVTAFLPRRSPERMSSPARCLARGKYPESTLRRKVRLMAATKVCWSRHARVLLFRDCALRELLFRDCRPKGQRLLFRHLRELFSRFLSPALASPLLADATALVLHLVAKPTSRQVFSIGARYTAKVPSGEKKRARLPPTPW